jgi:hypothetical protein
MEQCNNAVVETRLDMGDLAVIDVEKDCTLLSFNGFVPYIRVTWILGEFVLIQAVRKLAIVQQTATMVL